MSDRDPAANLYAILLRDAVDKHNTMVAKHEAEVMDSLRLIMEIKKHVGVIDCGHHKETSNASK